MSWEIDYHEEAIEDLKKLDGSVRVEVIKGIQKVSENPLPSTEGGYGKPLGNHSESNLSGCFKIKYMNSGVRVVYNLDRRNDVMFIIIISVRDDNYVYRKAHRRLGR